MGKIVLIFETFLKVIDLVGKIADRVDEEQLKKWNEDLDAFAKITPDKIKTPEDAMAMARAANDLIRRLRRPKD